VEWNENVVVMASYYTAINLGNGYRSAPNRAAYSCLRVWRPLVYGTCCHWVCHFRPAHLRPITLTHHYYYALHLHSFSAPPNGAADMVYARMSAVNGDVTYAASYGGDSRDVVNKIRTDR
jgi:hypothetical protein